VVGTSNSLDFKDVLSEIPSYEQSHRANVGINFALHTPNSLVDLHDVFIGAEWMKRDPWNISAFDSVPVEHRPIAAQLLELKGSYFFFSPLFQFGLEAQHADTKLSSDLTRTRLRTTIRKSFFLGKDDHAQLAFTGHVATDFGDELPQDPLGFYKYDQFEQGFNFTSIQARDRLPGIRRYYYGNRLVTGSVELIQMELPSLVEFFDIGSTWYAEAPTNNANVTITPLAQTEWLKTAGVELRAGPFEGGVGWELVKDSKADWFFRITTDF
jgi:hypothetical protein